MRRCPGLGHQALQLGVQRDHVQLAGAAVDLLHDGRRQVHADAAGQLGRVGDHRGMLGQACHDRAHVADVDAFLEEKLEDLLQCRDTDHLGDYVFDQLRGQLHHVLDELLGLDPAQQLGRVNLHQV